MYHPITTRLFVVTPLFPMLLSSMASAQPLVPLNIAGVWQADGGTFRRDVHNPDPKLKGGSLEGLTILRNLTWTMPHRRWEGRQLHDGTSRRNHQLPPGNELTIPVGLAGTGGRTAWAMR